MQLRPRAAYAAAEFALPGVEQRGLDVATLCDAVLTPLRERPQFAPVAAVLQEYCAR